jgi:hypothetical protein
VSQSEGTDIVEQGEIARIGKAEFENDELTFFNATNTALAPGWHPGALLGNSFR